MANRLELLVSCVKADNHKLVEQMNISSDCVIINQCGKNDYEEFFLKDNIHQVKAYSFNEAGVGLSRNNALMRAKNEIVLFSDEDIVYVPEYEKMVVDEFDKHPEADMLLFNVKVCEERFTYWNDSFSKVGLMKCGRYPAYSIAIRTKKLHDSAVTFSLLFGGGAKYSNGEDSIFIRSLIKKGIRCFRTPVCIGEEIPRPSTWFSGYNEKFFFDRGVLYTHLYGRMDRLMALQFAFRKRKIMCQDIPWMKAYSIMLNGIKEARK